MQVFLKRKRGYSSLGCFFGALGNIAERTAKKTIKNPTKNMGNPLRMSQTYRYRVDINEKKKETKMTSK
ncbi:MAG: hypothetical protein WAW15_00430 [Minisyncoccales bacterium]